MENAQRVFFSLKMDNENSEQCVRLEIKIYVQRYQWQLLEVASLSTVMISKAWWPRSLQIPIEKSWDIWKAPMHLEELLDPYTLFMIPRTSSSNWQRLSYFSTTPSKDSSSKTYWNRLQEKTSTTIPRRLKFRIECTLWFSYKTFPYFLVLLFVLCFFFSTTAHATTPCNFISTLKGVAKNSRVWATQNPRIKHCPKFDSESNGTNVTSTTPLAPDL